MIRVVAMPKFKDSIAPRFETAGSFVVTRLRDSREPSSKEVSSSGCEGFGRVRLLQDNSVTTLICSGIKAFYRELLVSSGIKVIDSVDMPLDEALQRFERGELVPVQREETITDMSSEIPHEDLMCWTRELFESHGYRIVSSELELMFPIDMVAETRCPVCRRVIRVAVCCGAHTYRSDQEIREFHHVTRSSYQARVYVYPAGATVRKCCREYGIQVVDPDADALNRDHVEPGRIPLLDRPIPGHERAFAAGGSS